MKRFGLVSALIAILVVVAVSYADFSSVTFSKYTTHYYYQTEVDGEWHWNDTIHDKVPEDFHGDINYYIDYIGYTYMGDMERLCGEPIYVGTDHSH
jgi:hypothetical protein